MSDLGEEQEQQSNNFVPGEVSLGKRDVTWILLHVNTQILQAMYPVPSLGFYRPWAPMRY